VPRDANIKGLLVLCHLVNDNVSGNYSITVMSFISHALSFVNRLLTNDGDNLKIDER
jgi:hypothetical protein